MNIPHAQNEIRIDGVLAEAEWDQALKAELPFETYPGENTKAPVRTECFLAYDDSNLYVAFHAYDPDPHSIRAHLADRDQIDVADDIVGFLVDTFNDHQRSLEFYVNAMSVQSDAMSGDYTWDALWFSEGRITFDGYVIEIAIPFSSLRFPQTKGPQTWGFMAFRSYPRSIRREVSLTRDDPQNSCYLCQAAKIIGFSDIKRGRHLEVTPTLTSHHSAERDDFPSGSFSGDGFQSSGGLSTRWGITSEWQLDATLNPDFSQVESDALQLDVNTLFALYYDERRPFFLENTDLFQTELATVYTRAIADPSWAFKFSGKQKANALGVLIARDDLTNLVFPANQESGTDSLDESSVTSVMRYRRDLFTDSYMGVLITDRQSNDYYNRLLGFDGRLRVSSSDSIGFQIVGSATRYPQRIAEQNLQSNHAFAGAGALLSYAHSTRKWRWTGSYQDLSSDFRADSGFIPQVDIRELTGTLTYNLFRPERRVDLIRFFANGFYQQDHDGNLIDELVSGQITASGPLQSSATFRYFHSRTRFHGVTYDLDSYRIPFSIRPNGNLRFSTTFSFGHSIDYVNARSGTTFSWFQSGDVSFTKHLVFSFSHTYSRLNLTEGRLYGVDLLDTATIYQFSVRSFVRAIVQYSDTRRATELYTIPVQPRTRRVATQFLYSYKLTPRTLAFVGYSDNYLGDQNLDLTRTDRTFFFKISYDWLL